MGPSKRWKRKQSKVSVDENLEISKGKALDTSLQFTNTVSEYKNKVHDTLLDRDPTLQLPVKGNLESASQIAENHAEVSGTPKKIKRKNKRSNAVENNTNQNLVEENLEISEGKICDTSLQNTKTVSNIENNVHDSPLERIPHLESPVNGSLGIALQTAEMSAAHSKIKRKKKRHTDPENNDAVEKPLESGSLCGSDVTNVQNLEKNIFSETSEMDSMRNTKSNEVSIGNNLTAVEPSSLSKSVSTNSMKKNDLVSEIDTVSIEVERIKTYQRKKKKLFSTAGNSLEQDKEDDPSTSLQVIQNHMMGEVSHNCLDNALTLVESKGRIKSKNVKDEYELNEVQRVVMEIGVPVEENLKKSPKMLPASSHNKLERVEVAGPVSSLQVVQNCSMGDVSINCSDAELEDMYTCTHVVQGNEGVLNMVHKEVQELGCSAKENLEESPTDCKKDNSFSMFETGDTVEHVCPSTLEVINKQVLSEFYKEGCSTSSPAVENAVIVESSANYSKKRSASRRRVIEKVKRTHHEGMASDTSVCNASLEQLEPPEVRLVFGEKNLKVEPSYVSGKENPESLNEYMSKKSCSSSPVVESPMGKSCINCSDKGRRRFKRKKAKLTDNEDKASDDTSICDPSVKQLEHLEVCRVCGEENLEVEEAHVFGQKNHEVEASSVFGEENLEVSLNECKMEEIISSSSNGDVIKDGIMIGVSNKEDNPLEMFPALPQRPPIICTRRKLLILDLNGLLADVVSDIPYGYKADKTIAKKGVFKRPFCDDFLNFCFERFNVGVWSSRTKRNVDSVVDFLMGDMKQNLLFCWDQSHCTETGFSTIENRNKPLVLKELKKLWDKHVPNLPWEKGEYNESNTLLLDDSPYKALRNPPHTAVFPYSYRFRNTDDKSLGPGGDLRIYLEGLATTEDVQKYIEQHPFGQRAITNKNPSWRFYLKVIAADKSRPEDHINRSSTHFRMCSTD